ncbi:MAG: sodium:proton antiporter [Pseudomonadota bacterium]
MENLVLAFSIIGVLGIGAQWIAWRFNRPAIVIMAVAGILAGPVTQILWPAGYNEATAALPPMETLFGEFYRPIIGIAVAVILFEGGLTLNFSEIRGVTKGVGRLVFPGAFLAWALGALAGHYIGGLTWPVALLFAGVMIVTGPTVIIPLLRQSKLTQRPAALLKWEGIINDPLGALFAVLVYEVATFEPATGHAASPTQIFLSLVLAAALAIGLGFALGRMGASAFRRGWVPEYLKPPVLLVMVLVCFEFANLLQEEAGLLAVTVMGVTLANSRIASINELRLFKENVAVLLVSGVFIILTANLTWGMFGTLDWQAGAFLAAMLFIVRPLTIFVSTIGAGLPLKERLLVGWIAPRGIVAVAVSSFFGASLLAFHTDRLPQAADEAERLAILAQIDSAEKLIPLAFAMVFLTVVLHGFSIGPLSRLLGLSASGKPGVLISGASPWSAALAAKLHEMEIPVVLADASWRRLRPARLANVPTYYGEILSEVTEHHLDLNRFSVLMAVSGNEAHNALVCTDLAPEMGRAAIYQVNARGKDEEDRRALSYTLQGRTLLKSGTALDELLKRYYGGWIFQRTRLSEEYGPEKYLNDLGKQGEIVMILRKGQLLVASKEVPLAPEVNDIVLAYTPKPPEKTRQKDKQAQAKEAPPVTPEEAQALEIRREVIAEKASSGGAVAPGGSASGSASGSVSGSAGSGAGNVSGVPSSNEVDKDGKPS